jgi:hypothetical protein
MKKLIIVSLLAAFMSGCALYIPRPVPVVTYSYAEPALMVVPTYRERRVIYRSPPPRVINNHYYNRCKVYYKRGKKYCR